MTFEESWPALSRRLTRFLAARGVPVSRRDDVIQEVGLRLFRAWDRVDPDQGPWGLARTIAVHAIVDSNRGPAEVVDVPELADDADVEGAAIARFRLSSVRHALSHMSPVDRRVLLAEVGSASPPVLGTSAMKMARARARRRLRTLVERPGAWGTLAMARLRLMYCRVSFDLRRWLHPHLADGIVATVAMMVSLTVLSAGSDAPAPRRSEDRAVESHSNAVAARGRIAEHDLGPGRSSASDSAANLRHDPSRDQAEETSPPADADHWIRESAGYVRQDTETVRGDAEQAGEDAKQIGEDAEQVGEDAEQLAEDAGEWPEDLKP